MRMRIMVLYPLSHFLLSAYSHMIRMRMRIVSSTVHANYCRMAPNLLILPLKLVNLSPKRFGRINEDISTHL